MRYLILALAVGVVLAAPVLGATYTVTTQADAGAGSLRDAITSANGSVGADTIDFANPGMIAKTIHILSDLPQLTDNATSIDGDINNDGRPDVAISGDQASIGTGLYITSANNVIHGLCFNMCDTGIQVNGSGATGNLITGCYLGTSLNGLMPAPNTNYGISINYANGNTVGGLTAATRNVIAGNYSNGIYLYRTRNTVIRDSYIGLKATATAAMPNAGYAVYGYYAADTTIGAANAAARNVFSGNWNGGISMYYSAGLKVLNTFVGTNPAGTAAIPNGGYGMYLSTCNQAEIGGVLANEFCVVSGNDSTGLYATNCFGGPVVRGNMIGCNLAGTAPLANDGNGIQLGYCSSPSIGGNTAAARNIIGGNGGSGMYLSSCSGASIKGNYLGVVKTGNAALPNDDDGIRTYNCATLTVGGTTAAERNVICGGSYGVRITGGRTTGNSLIFNFIGYGADGTTPMYCQYGIYVCPNARNCAIGSAGKGNRILARTAGLQFDRVASGCTAVGNRIGAPVGTTPRGGTGISVEDCRPTIDGNTIFQQINYGLYVQGEGALPIVKNNVFRRNNYACYIDDDAQPNLGDLSNVSTTDDGNNTFTSSTLHDIHNASAHDIRAEGNTFMTTSAETIDAKLIYDELDDPRYGPVDYDPLKTGPPTLTPLGMTVAAAPTRGGGAQIVVSLAAAGELSAQVANMAGRPVRTWSGLTGTAGMNTLLWDGKATTGLAVPAGAYLVTVTCRADDGRQQRQMARVQVAR